MPDADIELAQVLWDYLRYENPLEKSDVIIGLGSHDTQTAEWCAKLYNQGWAGLILFCGGRGRLTENITGNEADRYAETALSLGVPASAILRDTTSTNTGENIVHARRILEENRISARRVILVTKPYMLRRAYATFMKQWPGNEKPEVICSAVDKEFVNYGSGLETLEYTIEIMVGDLQRIREYPKRGFQIQQDIPSSVWSAYEQLVARGYTSHLLR